MAESESTPSEFMMSYKITEEPFKHVFSVEKFLGTAGTQHVAKSEECLTPSGNIKLQLGVMCLNKNKKTASLNILLYGRATKRQISVVGVKFAIYNPFSQNIGTEESSCVSTWKTLNDKVLEYEIISEYQTEYKYCRGYYSDNFDRGYGYSGEGDNHVPNRPFDRKSICITVTGTVLMPVFERVEIDTAFNNVKLDDTINVAFDLSVLLEKPKYSDIEISAGGKTFCVHKSILWARSETFAQMFEESEANNWSAPLNIIAIDNFSENVVKEALYFIYTGKCPKIKEMVFDLLAFSEKYKISDLKNLCESEIKCSVNVENVCDFLGLADKHNADSLKQYCINLIKSSMKSVVATEKWKKFRKVNPELTGDIMESFFVE